MKQKLTPLVVGNWKMNPSTLADARKLFTSIRTKLRRKQYQTEIMVAPPFPFISDLSRLSPSGRISMVAQAMSNEPVGAYTGDVSAPMLKSIDVRGVIVGHSERRAAGMTDKMVNAVLLAALKAQLLPIVCIGERERDMRGDFYDVIEAQLQAALSGVPAAKLSKLVIAYEPVWAIGTGNTATPEDVLEMKLFIQKQLITLYGRAVVPKVRILYGGSVNTKNVEALIQATEVDGFLLGGASLKVEDFCSIVACTEKFYVTA